MVPVAPPVFAYWRAVDDLAERLGPVRLVLSGSAPLSAELIEEFTDAHRHPDPPGLRPHRGRAGGHQHAVQRASCQNGSVGAALPGHRDPAGRRRPASRPRARTPARSRSAAPTCSAATGPTARTAPTPRAGGPPATSASSTATGDLFLVDRLKELVIVSGFNVYPIEVEDVIREVAGVTEAAVIGVEDEQHRRGRGGLRRRARRATREARRGRRTRALRGRGWPGSSSPAGSRSSTSCPAPSPARSRRAGCAASSGGGRSASSSDDRP